MAVNETRPRVGISACLLGEPVRFDGGHKRDPYIVETLGQHVSWVPVCPEVEAGLGTPRETMRLVLLGRPDRTRGGTYSGNRVAMVVHKTGEERHADHAAVCGAEGRRSGRAAPRRLVLKKDSPSCGMERVRIYGPAGPAERAGRGVLAEALMARLPNLPVEEEGRLNDPRLRENFVERVFAYQRLHRLLDDRWTVGDLVRFHTAHKLTLMAHSPSAYRELGRLVAGAGRSSHRAIADEYESAFMQALRVVATPKKHANVLQHIVGYFKKTLDQDARAELLALIDEHRLGLVPLVVPVTLVRHHVRRLKVEYLAGQVYLNPHPRELSLRNHV